MAAGYTKGARMTDTNTGWRKRQIALDIKAENARELGLDYDPVHPTQRQWVRLTDGVMCDIAIKHGLMSIDWIDFARDIEQASKEKNFD
jgi:hypothetical protein